MSEIKQISSPISSGWRGDINGHIENTGSHIQVSEITLKLDKETAYALCNVLADSAFPKGILSKEQQVKISNLGAALGRVIDHYSANNGEREIIK